MPNGEVNTETEESIFKIQNYPINDDVQSGWFKNSSADFRASNGNNLNQASIKYHNQIYH